MNEAPRHESNSGLRILSRSELAEVPITPSEVVRAVEDAYVAWAAGDSTSPRKLSVSHPDGSSVAYAMLGRDGTRRVVAMKTSYKFDPAHDRQTKRYYTTLLLYDDDTGAPIALMDCSRIGALRTPAVSALLVREAITPDARTVLLLGTGTQGRGALPPLLATNPQLDRLLLYGTHPDGIAAVHEDFARYNPDIALENVADPYDAAREADVILATAGPGTRIALESEHLRPGSVSVLVGHGFAPSTLRDADRVIATNAEQMQVTGTDLADDNGHLRAVDAELPEILAGHQRARHTPDQRIFAYNSGVVLTDIAVAHALAQQAIAAGRGTEVALWQ